jgi:hypothetical protein
MSGFEVASVVFGLQPLLVSAAEHYGDVCRPFERWKNFSKDVKRFESDLRVQERIFLNTSQLLLQHVTSQETAEQVLNSSPKVGKQLDEALVRAMGSSGGECIDIIQTIKESLEKLDDENFLNLEREYVKYQRIVRKCLRSDFGVGADLDKPILQERFFEDVVCKLEVKLRDIDLRD